MDSYILGLDIGTSTLHCLLADSRGRPVATADAPMIYHIPQGCPSVAREFQPDATLNTLGQLVRVAVEQGGITGADISAIGVTSQRQGIVFLDDGGKEIYSGPNIDLRAIFEGAAIDEEFGEEIYCKTGHFPSMLLAPARLRWFRIQQPFIYNRTCSILTAAGWLAYRLTGCITSEPSLDAEAGLADVKTGERCPALMGKLGVSSSLLPPLIPPGLPAGHLNSTMADHWGIRPGIPVAIAGPDTQCGLLGMGLRREGQAGALIGWSGAIQVLTSQTHHDGQKRSWVGRYPRTGLWVAEANIGDAGRAYGWLKDIFLGRESPYEEAEHLAQQASAAPEGVLALLGPAPVSSLNAGCRIGGLFFPTPLSFQEATRGQLLRAALENVAYSVKANLATLGQVTGLVPDALFLGGGMARSRTLAASLANVLGFPVIRSNVPQVSARGAALVAAVSCSSFATLEEATADQDPETVEPQSLSAVAEYQEHYHEWMRTYQRLESE